jgi:uncharacterized protein YndB with AHSA1/START domain
MPIKKDGTGKRWVEMEVLVPGTPEQVWQAMATGPGNTAWFTRTTIEEKVGGKLSFNFGPEMSSIGEINLWEPPHRFGYTEHEWDGKAPPVATEITITSRSGDQCLVRMVHSLFASSDDWDDQMEGFEGGWPGFFAVLRLYLAHFAGLKGASFGAMQTIAGEHLSVWAQLTERLGLAGANVGERRELQAVQAFAGTVEQTAQNQKQRHILLRSDDGVALIGSYLMGDKVNVSASLFCYGDDADKRAAEAEPKWQAWLKENFAAAG